MRTNRQNYVEILIGPSRVGEVPELSYIVFMYET